MAQFSEEWLEEVRSRTDIVALIGEKVELRSAGQSLLGRCPFHEEKTPSFHVNREKQFFHCFGCGAGGNVFRYVMRDKGLAFPQAVLLLAEKAGIPVPVRDEKEAERARKKNRLMELNKVAARFFYQQLYSAKGSKARNYLTRRKIETKEARTFFLGYALDSWDGLLSFLKEQGVLEEEAYEAGLVGQGKKGYYDRFRDRLIFPILSPLGHFLGFGARSLHEDPPKYLNSPETLVFQKNQILYGLNWANEQRTEKEPLVIVEGYTDLIRFSSIGVKNVCATLGTAFSSYHAKLLAQVTEEVIICFDGDSAGEKATLAGLSQLRMSGLQVRVSRLPKGQDPDSYALHHSKVEVRKLLKEALPFWEYRISRIAEAHNLSHREGKLQASSELIGVLQEMDSAMEVEQYLPFGAELLGVGVSSLLEELNKTRERSRENLDKKRILTHNLGKKRNTTIVAREHKDYRMERDVLRWVLKKPALGKELEQRGFQEEDFQDKGFGHLFSLLVKGQWDKEGELVADSLFRVTGPLGNFEEYLAQFRARKWIRELSSLEEKLQEMENHKKNRLEGICNLLLQYYRIRQEVHGNLKKKGPLGRGDFHEQKGLDGERGHH